MDGPTTTEVVWSRSLKETHGAASVLIMITSICIYMLSHRGDWACFRLLTTVIGVAAKAFRRRPSAAPSLLEMDWENLGYISSSSLCWQGVPKSPPSPT